MPTDSDVIDVAIIGAGASGAYCAFRLSSDTRLSVAVFERNDRVGGRLWSYRWPEAGALVELGGEAFSPIHVHVAGVVRRLGLPAVPHREFSTLHRLYLRDRLIGMGDLLHAGAFPARAGAAAKVRYFVPEDYLETVSGTPGAGGGPQGDAIDDPFAFLAGHILRWLPEDVRAAFGALTDSYARRIAEVTGGAPLAADQALRLMTPEIYATLGTLIERLEAAEIVVRPTTARILDRASVPLHDFDFWSVVVRDFGQEVYELFRDAGYDNTSALYYNMLELFENLLIGALLGMASPGFWSLEGGFDTLPKAMMQAATAKGATLALGQRLTGVTHDPATGLLRLDLADAAGARQERLARRVVMTAPVTLFDGEVALQGFDAGLAARFQVLRDGLFQVPAGKLFLAYPEPWWRRMADLVPGADPLYGYANTDMPSRAVYYKGYCEDGRRGLITGALTDGINAEFWASFRRPGAALFPGTGGGTPSDRGAPRLMVDACHGILQRIHAEGLPGAIDPPDLALYHGWHQSGAGWSAWHSGVEIHRAAAAMRRPFTDGGIDQGLYCCGDSVAERHGWVEDVLESAETLLREGFGLAPADWLPGATQF